MNRIWSACSSGAPSMLITAGDADGDGDADGVGVGVGVLVGVGDAETVGPGQHRNGSSFATIATSDPQGVARQPAGQLLWLPLMHRQGQEACA
ncbi:hypothetical protein FGB62_30g044 [Gracilaria domingensis]|nr:hypothetical protein FGB62_30g044 [Gracilaria domingensis]